MFSMLIQAAAQAAQSHLTLRSVISDIPHDPAAFVVYALSGAAVAWVLIAGRRKGEGKPGGSS